MLHSRFHDIEYVRSVIRVNGITFCIHKTYATSANAGVVGSLHDEQRLTKFVLLAQLTCGEVEKRNPNLPNAVNQRRHFGMEQESAHSVNCAYQPLPEILL